MNKTFKTIWNEARRSYIVTNEAQKTHGKPSKSAVSLSASVGTFNKYFYRNINELQLFF